MVHGRALTMNGSPTSTTTTIQKNERVKEAKVGGGKEKKKSYENGRVINHRHN